MAPVHGFDRVSRSLAMQKYVDAQYTHDRRAEQWPDGEYWHHFGTKVTFADMIEYPKNMSDILLDVYTLASH
ncbi:MAG: hypothetical protein WB699_06435 [Bacteroidota bacterium]